MNDEIKDTISEDLKRFKSWSESNLTLLKPWWIRLLLSMIVTYSLSEWLPYRLRPDLIENDELFIVFSFLINYIGFYIFIVWVFGKKKDNYSEEINKINKLIMQPVDNFLSLSGWYQFLILLIVWNIIVVIFIQYNKSNP